MADYKELLRRAISALPENNGAARRAVYEKARSALVAQLRAIEPPLPAREITQHRLQLEDCIRLVEQEASEAVISLGRDTVFSRPVAPAQPPAAPESKVPAFEPVRPKPAPVVEKLPDPEPTPEPKIIPRADAQAEPTAVEPAVAEPTTPVAPAVQEQDNPLAPAPAPITSIEEIIAEAASTKGVEIVKDDQTDKADAPTAPSSFPAPPHRPEPKTFFFTPRKGVDTPPATHPAAPAAAATAEALASTALASQPETEPVIIEPALPVEPALSAVNEVELEGDNTKEAEGAIERAIETLDREARGESTGPSDRDASLKSALGHSEDSASFEPIRTEGRSGPGLTIFLIVFALLLAGAGGAGFWAWREGYVDLDQMFGRSEVAAVSTPAPTTEPSPVPSMDNASSAPTSSEDAQTTGPGNTATTAPAEPTSALEGTSEDRLPATPSAALPSLNGETKIEERLSGQETQIAGLDDPAASVDPSVLAGNQSLLLEASTTGGTGAIPFSGSVEWTEGVDEVGLATLIGEASIPARNLGVTITIRRNTDPVLPASHLMEITFDVPDTFAGGNIATLAGVLLKDSELVPGTALIGASARVLGNSFLFALSASPADIESNIALLQNRRWLDLAMVYGSGRNAILTLEKDDEAQAVFDKVLADWAN